jgi:hypothetical protein
MFLKTFETYKKYRRVEGFALPLVVPGLYSVVQLNFSVHLQTQYSVFAECALQLL